MLFILKCVCHAFNYICSYTFLIIKLQFSTFRIYINIYVFMLLDIRYYIEHAVLYPSQPNVNYSCQIKHGLEVQ